MLLNLERMLKTLKEHDLAGLVATAPENVTYASDHDSALPYYFKGLQEYVVLNAEGRGGLVIPAADLAHLAARPSWIEGVWTYGSFFVEGPFNPVAEGPEQVLEALLASRRHFPSAAEALVNALQELGLSQARIGLDESNFDGEARAHLQSALPGLHLTSGASIFKLIRMVKSDAEIQRLSRAAAVNQEALQAMLAKVREGVTEAALMQIHRETLARHNASAALNSGGVGTRSGAPFLPPSDYKMRPGDIFRFDATGTLDRYWADFGRSAVLGEPSKKVRDYYDAIHSGFMIGLNLIRAGQTAAGIFEAVMETVRSNGIGHYRRHHVGHGIGVEVYDSPLLGPAGKADIFKEGAAGSVLEENMVVCLEVPYYELGFGGLQIEDTLVVGAGGCYSLTTLDRGLFVC